MQWSHWFYFYFTWPRWYFISCDWRLLGCYLMSSSFRLINDGIDWTWLHGYNIRLLKLLSVRDNQCYWCSFQYIQSFSMTYQTWLSIKILFPQYMNSHVSREIIVRFALQEFPFYWDEIFDIHCNISPLHSHPPPSPPPQYPFTIDTHSSPARAWYGKFNEFKVWFELQFSFSTQCCVMTDLTAFHSYNI